MTISAAPFRRPAAEVCADPLQLIIKAADGLDVALAVADARVPGAPIIFANAAAAKLAQRTADELAGEPLTALAGAEAENAALESISEALEARSRGRSASAAVEPAPGSSALAMSIAAVASADGAPLYLVCALLAAGGADAVENARAIERSAALLAQTAAAIESLMRESQAASTAAPQGPSAEAIAKEALETSRSASKDGHD